MIWKNSYKNKFVLMIAGNKLYTYKNNLFIKLK